MVVVAGRGERRSCFLDDGIVIDCMALVASMVIWGVHKASVRLVRDLRCPTRRFDWMHNEAMVGFAND